MNQARKFTSFEELNIPQSIKDALREMDFVTPTPIQSDALPAGLEGKDIVGTAQTGTGKTAAFAIPMLSKLYSNPGKIGLVLAPTRELASQIYKVVRQMARGSSLKGSLVVGGESFRRQQHEIADGVDFIIATPGRLNDHLRERTADLSKVSFLVLDEVDRMLDMGFLPQIKEVLAHVPKHRQTMLYSATLPAEVSRFVDALVSHPVRVKVGDVSKPSSKIKEIVVHARPEEKGNLLLAELAKRTGKVLIFVRTKSRTHRLARLLDRKGFDAVLLHGGRSQGQRKQALDRFRGQSHPIMVATDLAGRGLDILDIDHVINFDIPYSREDYIHRIGRTGRANRSGEAVSFVEEGNRGEEKIVQSLSHERVASRESQSPAKPRVRPGFSSGQPRGQRFSVSRKPMGRADTSGGRPARPFRNSRPSGNSPRRESRGAHYESR